MLVAEAREHARREGASATLLHHALLACAADENTAAGQLLRESGWRDVEVASAAVGGHESPSRTSPELVLHLTWVAGFRAARSPSVDHGVCFLLSCVVGPTDSVHGWLEHRGVDLDVLCRAAASALSLPESICERRRRWSKEWIVVAADEVEDFTRELRRRGQRYKFNWRADRSAVILPEELPESRRLP